MNSTPIFPAATIQHLSGVFQKHGIRYAGVFGSVARGDARADSDVDLLVEFSPDRKISLFDVARAHLDVQEVLQREVDFVQKDAIKSSLKPYIMRDLITLYEQ